MKGLVGAWKFKSFFTFFGSYYLIFQPIDWSRLFPINVETQWMSHHLAQASLFGSDNLFHWKKCHSKQSRDLKTCHLFSFSA